MTPKLKLYCLEDLSPQIILGSSHLYDLDLYGELPELELARRKHDTEMVDDFDVEVPSLAANGSTRCTSES